MMQNTATADDWPTDQVARALRLRLGMDPADAAATAEELHQIFKGRYVIEDTEVQSPQRSFLWSLLVDGVVTVETQERRRPEDGRKWRYYYWHLVPPERLVRRAKRQERPAKTVYDRLPDNVWRRPPMAAV